MSEYNTLIHLEPGGSQLTVESGGEIEIESGGAIDVESGASLKFGGSAIASSAAELDQRILNQDVTLGTAGTAWLVVPMAGQLVKAYSIIDQALTTGDETLIIANTGGTACGTITITQSGSAAGDIDSVTPAANNTFAAGDKLRLAIGGENGTAAVAEMTYLFQVT